MGKVANFIMAPLATVIGGKTGRILQSVGYLALGIATGNPGLIAAGVGGLASSLQKAPKIAAATVDRLNPTFDTSAPRVIVFGDTAMGTDVRYQAYTGASQEYFEQIVACAAHEVQSIDSIWFDTDLAWTLAGGVQPKFAGYLEVTPRTVGTSANGIAIDSTWTATATLTGCAYVHFKYKRTGNSKKAESPFSQSVPSRMTIRGKGAKVYDARFDTTAGGSGPMRLADQTTWAYSYGGVDIGRIPSNQLLWYLTGWRINGKLSVGRGIPAARFGLASFINGANLCDEAVTKAAGGIEPRYRSDGVFSEGDDPSTVLGNLYAAMNGDLDDAGGRLEVWIDHNDLAVPAVYLDDDDILGEEHWAQTPEIDGTFNVVRGRYTDPSDKALFQLVDLPEVEIASPDGIERVDPFDIPTVQSPSQGQRLFKQRLQANLYRGEYRAHFGSRAWKASRHKIVALSHGGLGWTNKLFRVASQGVSVTGRTPLVLREVHASVYAWAAEESPAVVAAIPTAYDPLNDPIIRHLSNVAEGATRNVLYRQVSDPAGSNTLQNGDVWVDISGTPMVIKIRIGASWQVSGNYVTEGSHIGVANGATKNVIYRQSGAPSSPADGDMWVDTSATPNVVRTRVSGAWQASANLVTQGDHIGVENGSTRNGPSASINRNDSFSDWDGSEKAVAYSSAGGLPVQLEANSASSTRGPHLALFRPATGIWSEKFPVTASEPLWLDYRYGTSGNRAGGVHPIWHFGIQYYDSAGTIISTLYTTNGTAIAAGTVKDEIQATIVPVGAAQASLYAHFDWTEATGGVQRGFVDYFAVTRHEPAADVGTEAVVTPELLFPATSAGVVKSTAFPKTVTAKLSRQGVYASSGVTYSWKVVSGTVNGLTSASGSQAMTVTSGTGTLDITALVGDAVIEVTPSYGGSARAPKRVNLTRVPDPPPSSGGSGGGSGGSASTKSVAGSATGTTPVVLATFDAITIGSLGQATLAANITTSAAAASPAGTFEGMAVFQRNVSGTWTDVGTATASDPDSSTVFEPPYVNGGDGAITISTNATGLTVGSSQSFRLVGYRSTSSPAKTLNFNGSGTVQG